MVVGSAPAVAHLGIRFSVLRYSVQLIDIRSRRDCSSLGAYHDRGSLDNSLVCGACVMVGAIGEKTFDPPFHRQELRPCLDASKPTIPLDRGSTKQTIADKLIE